MGAASCILGMDITRDRKNGVLTLSQGNYIRKVLKTFGMSEATAVTTPLASHFKLRSLKKDELVIEKAQMDKVPYSSVVGSMMYAMIGTRPDLAYAVGVISRFMSKLGRKHWEAVKWVLRYLRGET